MASLDDFRALFAYDHWANGEIRAALDANHLAAGKVVDLLAHILAVKDLWLTRLEGKSLPDGYTPFPAGSLPACDDQLAAFPPRLDAYLDGLGDDGLTEDCAYRTTEGVPYTSRREDILYQMVLHGPHHRGQIALLLREAGIDPPVLDYIHYMRTR